jgi:hypothetical protein
MICYIRTKLSGTTIQLERKPQNFDKILEEFLSHYNIVAEKPVSDINSIEVIWSEKIALNHIFKKVPIDFIRSGVYRVFYDDEIIYIGSSDADGRIKNNRKGMYTRRTDFKTTLLGCERYKCASSEISKFFYNNKKFPEKDLYRIKHQFFPCHPDNARDLEFKIQKEHKKQFGHLPKLNIVEYSTGGARKVI